LTTKKLAIVGAQELTRNNAPWNDPDCDIWVISNWANANWCKRCNGVIEIHEPHVYRNHEKDPQYWQWLQDNQTARVIMFYPDDRVPMAEHYPLGKVSGLIENLKVRGREAQNFASSVDYALALAIVEQYEQIDVYGVEMAHSSEYRSQQASFAFWVGFCAGKGINLNINCTQGLFIKPLYGTFGNADGDLDSYIEGITQQLNETKKNVDMLEGAIGIVRQMKSDRMEIMQGETHEN